MRRMKRDLNIGKGQKSTVVSTSKMPLTLSRMTSWMHIKQGLRLAFSGQHRKIMLLNIVTCHSDCRLGFGLVIGFINHLQVVTTINHYTIAALHNVQSLHTNLFS
jgi:hypothetical protein